MRTRGKPPSRRGRVAGAWVPLAGVTALVACAGDAGVTSVTARGAVTMPPVTAMELAASQTTPDTVAPPALPPPCDPSMLAFTATLSDTGEPLLRLENRSGERCEVTFADSPVVDPSMEPDVWLDAGGAGELLTAVDSASCAMPGPVDSIGLVVNGAPVAVPIERIEVCTLRLVALYAL